MDESRTAPPTADPVPEEWARLLRSAALALVVSERRRAFPPLLHVGSPDRPPLPHAAQGPGWDHGLRCDLLGALLEAALPQSALPLVWLTRTGPLTTQDVDLAWVAAARAASGERGLPWTMVTVTREGWRDHRTGTTRCWRRLRAG